MKKTLLSLMALTIFFAACKKNDDTTPGGEPKIKRVATGSYTNDFEYNADNTLKSSTERGEDDFWRTFFKYQDAKLQEIYYAATETDNTGKLATKVIYDGNRIIKLEIPDQSPEKRDKMDTLIYNASGNLLVVRTYRFQPEKTLISIDSLTWDKGNVIGVSSYHLEGTTPIKHGTRTLTYDNRKNYRQIPGLIYAEGVDYEALSANNVTEAISSSVNGTPLYTYTSNYTFEYNEKNLVSKVFGAYKNSQNDIVDKDTTIVTYH